ncbi:hypothetical protein [Ruminococcus gauvreauii]|uniref:Uncharacterized protein n=1 Tax=Ruminococcus gauvreauii TaxID=438033 RepID=A0ABY5VG43_9FIRM|nr:hypothetical protein [Ruminococcus gauvreauii]UWP59246.1 hypothetical protein NQ502_18075 [Ruminococcus gauvreauii]
MRRYVKRLRRARRNWVWLRTVMYHREKLGRAYQSLKNIWRGN